ncbi:MAG: sensor histidine kinase [Lachnospiraceae bacterium]|nr:sensor histidine kinase [Lachnospiraceae bacterium]MBD5455243.1 sensor histidine kinase [Lachnospiraceae bacterium]
MDDHQVPGMIYVRMLNLNLIIILYMAGIITAALLGYAQEGSALQFLQQIRSVPVVPWKLPVTVLLLFLCLLLFLGIQTESSLLVCFKIGMELAISLLISSLLNFSYTGFLFLIIADIMRRFPKTKGKFTAVGIVCVMYLLTDYNLFADRFHITSINSYLTFYRSDVRSIMLVVKNILDTLNMLLFIVYTILLMRIQMSEKERILQLNEKLNSANEELQRANRQMEEYSRESIRNAETQERNRLAREIHDTLGHTLTGIITGLDACVTLIDMAPEAVKEQLKVIADVARNGMTDVRRSVRALRPDALEKMELGQALEKMMEETKRASNIEIEYCCTAPLTHFNKDEEEIIYRIVQESITNAIRHGKASKILIAISMEYNLVNIWIKDNGIGCTKIEKGFGLHHMEERLSMLHGSLYCFVDNGFVLEAGIPIRWGEEIG